VNTVEPIQVARVARAGAGDAPTPSEARRSSFGLVLIAIVILGQALGLATNLLAGAAITALFATTFTLKRMRAEVRDLRAGD
jgi:hypothetical protein